jgi:hypothetical protein
MRFDRTDDPIKGVGYVTIYFASLEDEFDVLLRELHPLFDTSKVLARWQFGSRVEWLQKKVRQISVRSTGDDAEHIESVLNACKQVADARNELIHRPIISDLKGGSLRKMKDGEMEAVDARAIYGLAEQIIDAFREVGGLKPLVSRLVVAFSEPDSG